MVKSLSERPWLWVLMWAVPMAAAVAFRPILPVDETRYVSVAWDMWLSGNYLVPHLDGEPYSHKPPLLFWLINAGWWVFGVNEIWPRLVAPIFGLTSLFLTHRLTARLWPEGGAKWIAPLLLLGSLYWSLFNTLTMFDLMLCCWTLVGIWALVDLARTGHWRNAALFGVAIALGVLSKGPVILVFLLPAAIFAPLWRTSGDGPGWGRWYGAAALGLVFGAALALAWALPAGFAGGEAYRNAIFWGQSAGRMVGSFAHREPVWFYAALLPAMVLPWVLWPTFLRATWQGLKAIGKGGHRDEGLRLAAVWAIAALIFMTAISGKRPHYLLPMFPALAMIGAVWIARLESRPARWDGVLPALPILILAAAVLTLPSLAGRFGIAEWADVAWIWGVVPLAAGLWLALKPPAGATARAAAIAVTVALTVASIQGALAPRLAAAYDVRPVAWHVKHAQDAGHPIANYGKYHGQYNFLGRLTVPLDEVEDDTLPAWLAAHPDGKVVSYHKRKPAPGGPELVRAFRGRWIAVWDAAVLRADPNLAHPSVP